MSDGLARPLAGTRRVRLGIERRFLAPAYAWRLALEGFLHASEGGVEGGAGRGVGAFRFALRPLALAYGGVAALRGGAAHLSRVWLDRPVLSVGGLSMGGSGKTPFVRWLGQRLDAAGLVPAVLTRGHGWLEEGAPPLVLRPGDFRQLNALPDEARLFLRDGLAVGAHPRRARAAAALGRAGVHPDLFLLDDGFQHRGLHRDWNLVLLSRRDLLASRRPLPAGPFRERWQALSRADRIAITGLEREEVDALAQRSHAELGLPPGEPPLLAGLAWAGLHAFEAWAQAAGRPGGVGPLGGESPAAPLLAFSGIADPLAFERLLASQGLPLIAHVVFPDHHRYTPLEVARLLELVPAGGALVTTEKDAVRLSAEWLPPGIVRVAAARLVLWRGEESLLADLRRLVPAKE